MFQNPKVPNVQQILAKVGPSAKFEQKLVQAYAEEVSMCTFFKKIINESEAYM